MAALTRKVGANLRGEKDPPSVTERPVRLWRRPCDRGAGARGSLGWVALGPGVQGWGSRGRGSGGPQREDVWVRDWGRPKCS